ncbi:hypothetical protein WMQ59_22555 [Vibrio diabolicus]|uniref:hypothetical protein n=1 Tax=Vibrio diabolicus TaxID=50719 RepID=UPI003750ACF7
MNELEQKKVREYAENTFKWAAQLSNELSINLSSESLMLAMVRENEKELLDIALESWTYEQCKSWYSQSKLALSVPVIEEVVYLDESAIPCDTERAIEEELVKFKGERWVIHKNDADPFPSSPHAHNYEARLKLHMGNGDLYNGTELVGKMNKKSFIKLRNSFKKVQLPTLEI